MGQWCVSCPPQTEASTRAIAPASLPPCLHEQPGAASQSFSFPTHSQIVGGWGLVGTAYAGVANDNPGTAGIGAPVLGIACAQECRIANRRSSAGSRHGTRPGCQCKCLSRHAAHCAALCVVLTLDLRVVFKSQDEDVERQRPPKARRPGACGQEGGQAGGAARWRTGAELHALQGGRIHPAAGCCTEQATP